MKTLVEKMIMTALIHELRILPQHEEIMKEE